MDGGGDWGYAPEYMEAAWRMMQRNTPDDYVVGTGKSHSVRDFVEAALECAGISDWQNYVGVDPRYYRPTEVEHLVADPAKAKKELGWEAKTEFNDLVKIMVKHDLKSHGLEKEAEKITW